jgi:cobalt/nickel transport system permease protein
MNDSFIHRLHPLIKMLATLCYLIIVISFGKYEVSALVPLFLYPILVLASSDTPIKPLLYRLVFAIPFSFFATISNVFFENQTAFDLGLFDVSYGMLSFSSVMLKTVLTVFSVLILATTTPMPVIAHELVRLKIPNIFVTQLMLTYRYISVLIQETGSMVTAYHLRATTQKGIRLDHMGTFVGQLLLRSFDKADRIYYSMKCRGYDGEYKFAEPKRIQSREIAFLGIFILILIIMRCFNLSQAIGGIFN